MAQSRVYVDFGNLEHVQQTITKQMASLQQGHDQTMQAILANTELWRTKSGAAHQQFEVADKALNDLFRNLAEFLNQWSIATRNANDNFQTTEDGNKRRMMSA